jgi:thiol-disulfide isomerase/thioredoxin
MALRLLLLALAVSGTAALVAVWRRPSRRLSRPSAGVQGLPPTSIVQFTAPYCAPCKWNRPHLQTAAREAGVSYVEIDVGERPEVARRFGIRSVPVIVVTGPGGDVLGSWREPPSNGELGRTAAAALETASG